MLLQRAGWLDLRLRTKGLIVIGVPAAATVAIACVGYFICNRAVEAEGEVNRSYQVGGEIQRLRSHDAQASADVRGYFINGEEPFAAQARESLAQFDACWRRLVDLTRDNPAESKLLSRIGALARSRANRMSSDTARFQWDALGWDQLLVAMKNAEAERLEIETVLRAMEDEESRLLENRSRRVEALRAGLRATAGTCVFLGVTGGVWISILFASGITNRILALQKNVARMVPSGIFDALPPSRDEIGGLSAGMAKTAKALRHRTAALENATQGIAEADAAGRYVAFNRAYSELTGLSHVRSAPGVAATVHPDDRIQVDEALSRMRETGRAEVEARVVHPGGRIAYVGMGLIPMPENWETGYFVYLQDIDRRKAAEDGLVQVKDGAVASGLAKSQFLAKISHDIRTPLNAILGSADLLSQSALNSDQAEYVAMFQRNCRRLVALINDFLDFSKIEAGAVRIENVRYRIWETAAEAAATFRESAHRKGILLETEIGPDVPEWGLGDPLRVHQVLVNLLSNAIKFTVQGRVDLRVQRITDAGAERLRFSVSDTGPGIRTEDQQRVFAVFAQSGKPDLSAREGCGLGLAICRELVELMGGEIGLTSQERNKSGGSGSTFYFTLPLETAPPVRASEETTAPAPRTRRMASRNPLRVLAAEDTEDNRLLLAHYVRDEAIELQFAENGQEAVNAICRGEEFDLILMDMDMPVLDGLAAVRVIRDWQRENGTASTPIVGLSAHAMREAVRDCLDAGCAAHVAKPVDQATLLRAIRRYARRGRQDASAKVSDGVAALVPRYLESKLKQIEDARASLAARDLEPIRRFGHNLKGSGTGYGFPRIEEIGAEMEQAAILQDERSISEQLEALGRFLAEEHAGVTSCLGPIPPTGLND